MPQEYRSRVGLVFLAMLAAAACGDGGSSPDEPRTGNLRVTAATTGADLDSDGYLLTADDGPETSITSNGTRDFTGLTSGSHSLAITGVAANCTLVGVTPRPVTIVAGQQADLAIAVTCTAIAPAPGSIAVTVTTTGVTPDQDGYRYALDGNPSVPILRNTGFSIASVSPGAHSLTLSNLDPNCSVSGDNPLQVVVASGVAAPAAFAVACTPSLRNRILFASTRGTGGTLNELELWAVNPDGRDGFRITHNSAIDGEPVASPDGSRVLYSSSLTLAGPSQVWLANADGSNPVQLTTGASAGSAQWSPDGDQILFSREGPNTGVLDLVVMDSNGANPTIIGSTDPARTTRRFSPTWSADGTRIAFGTDSSLNSIAADGSDERVIYQGLISHVRWSPVDDRLVFNAPAEDPGQAGLFGTGIWIIHANGQGRTQLVTSVANTNNNSPSWSPDGSRLVYSRIVQPSGDLNIWVVLVDGSGATELAGEGDLNTTPSWR